MLSVPEARARLLAALPEMPSESVPLVNAAGRILAGDLHAPFDLPTFSNSSMDGFAVRPADIALASPEMPVRLNVVADIPAGRVPTREILPGEAARIMTGAQVPEGAGAVVPVELTDFANRDAGTSAPATVQIFSPASQGHNIRGRGDDVTLGDLLLPKGARLRPQDVGMAAMLGLGEIKVVRRPRVALLSTGDELTPPGEPRVGGQIFESNSFTIGALVEQAGGEVIRLGIAADRAEAVEALLDQAIALQADLIISSAGVSVGAFDFVKGVVESHGRLDFWRVNMRPGKPLAFGEYRGVPFVGLPGNPVSAFVGFEVFLRYALAKMLCISGWERVELRGKLGEPVRSDGRESYLRAVASREDGEWVARLTGHQGSGNQFSLVQANALVMIPAGVVEMQTGDEIQIWPLQAQG